MFENKIRKYFEEKGVVLGKMEGEDNSLVFHIASDMNDKVAGLISNMEKTLNVAVMLSSDFGMNVVIVEEQEDES